MALSNSEVYKRTINSGFWMTADIIVQKILGILSFLILSRLILPESYGIIASITILVGFLNVVSQTGFEAALIQSKDEIKSYLNKVWTLNILKSILIFAIIWFIAPIAARFFHVENYVSVIRFSGLFVVVEGMSNIGHIYFSKDINFRAIFFRDLGMPIAFFVTTILWLKFFGNPVWALAFGNLGSYLCAMIATYFLSSYRPRPDFNLNKLRELWSYGSWVVASNLANYVSGVIDSTFLAHLLGPGKLGIYSKGRDFSVIPSSYISQLANKIGFPSISNIQGDLELVRHGFKKLFDLTILISLPFMVLIFTQANHLISLILTDEWLQIVFPLKFLIVAMTIRGFVVIATPIFNGLGKPRIYFFSVLIQIATMFVSLAILVPRFEILGAAYSMIIATFCTFIFTSFHVLKLTRLRMISFLPSIFSVGFASILLAVCSIAFNRIIGFTNVFAYLFALCLMGAIYLGTVLLIGKIFKSGPGVTLSGIIKNLL